MWHHKQQAIVGLFILHTLRKQPCDRHRTAFMYKGIHMRMDWEFWVFQLLFDMVKWKRQWRSPLVQHCEDVLVERRYGSNHSELQQQIAVSGQVHFHVFHPSGAKNPVLVGKGAGWTVQPLWTRRSCLKSSTYCSVFQRVP